MFGKRKRETHRGGGGEKVKGLCARIGVGRRDLISYASADRSARGTVKSLEQNTTLSNELYVHNNIFLFHFDIQMKKASGLQIEEGREKKDIKIKTALNSEQE